VTGTDGDPYVGRQAELALVADRIAEARAGRGGLVLVGGPAGIGKTRLVEEATREARLRVVEGRCVDDEGAPPLWPWRTVGRTLPALAAVLSAPEAAGSGADPAAARFRLVVEATEALLSAALPDGLVVVLEDLHWADEASLRLLRHLAGELHRSSLLVLATHREPPGGALAQALPDLVRGRTARVLSLGPLSESEVSDYLRSLADGHVAAGTVSAVHRRSGGNPLYLRAVARAVGDGGAASRPDPAADGAEPVGDELRSVVRATLAAVPDEVAGLVVTAAVLGEDVDSAVLARMTGRTETEVSAGLDVAVRAGVLVPVRGVPGRRRFAHAVVRDGVYADLPPGEREALHRRAAQTLEADAEDDASLAGVVAGHWLRTGGEAATARRAAAWARRAAESATRSLALDESARFLATAWTALQRTGPSDLERAELLLDLAGAEYSAGRVAQSLRHAQLAADAATAAGRPDLVARSALVVHDVAAPGIQSAQIRLCERALTAGPDVLDPALRARVRAQLASVLADNAEVEQAAEVAVAALAEATASGDEEALIDAARARMKAALEPLDVAEQLRLGRLAIDHGRRTGRPLVALWGHKWRIDASLVAGVIGPVDAELAHVAELAATTRLPVVRWHDLRLRASLEALRGRFPTAFELNDEARRLAAAELAEDRSAVGMSWAFSLQHALLTGVLEQWDETSWAGLAAAPPVPIVRVSRALVLLVHGRREEAAALYDELRVQVDDPAFTSVSQGIPTNLVPLVEAFGDVETARVLLPRLAAHPFVAGGAGIYCGEPSATYVARLARVVGDLDTAATSFEAAAASSARIGARPNVVAARVGLAAVLLDRATPADLRRAQVLARQAADEARRLDMPEQLRRAAGLLDRARAGLRGADPLTRREREIADLVAAALSNRQIAGRLVLSERTVESHVSNILGKLGLANRTELATAVRAGTGPSP
jgi:DNA-binding CsgD family transcriptional regulator